MRCLITSSSQPHRRSFRQHTTKPRAAIKVTGNAAQVPDQLPFLSADPGNDAMKAGVMARTFWDGREGMRVGADHPPPTHDAVNARHRTVQVAARIVET